MSEQDGTQTTPKRRRSHQTSKQNSTQVAALQRPANDAEEAWRAYWEAQGQPWRIEPEIDAERQGFLDKRRGGRPIDAHGKYPFKDIKLSRADVEWLLATHENGRGPVDWSDENQRKRKGRLDLRGADLRGENLRGLPLAGMRGGRDYIVHEQRREPIVQLENADLSEAHLEGAILGEADLEGANLNSAHLESADLNAANLRRVNLCAAHLERTNLVYTHLESADLGFAHLEGADLRSTHLEGADLKGIYLDSETLLIEVALSNKEFGAVSLSDIHWRDANLTMVDWSAFSILGDEQTWQRQKDSRHRYKERLYLDQSPARAYRQLSVVLRNQGLSEDAARFTYRAQLVQRKVYWYQRKFGQYLFSLFLDLISGYGYKPGRSFLAYLLVITAFATAYFMIGHTVGPALSPVGSFVFSMTSFHGRGFFPGGITLDDPLTILAAIEAFVGLLIEVTFIATLTQRLFGK